MKRKELFRIALMGALVTSLIPSGYEGVRLPILNVENVYANSNDISDSITVYETLVNDRPIRVNDAESTHWIANLIFNRTPKPGEYFTVKLPREVNVQGDTTEKAKLPEFIFDGKKLADLSFDGKTNTLKYTFNNNVTNYEKVRYTLNMNAFVDREKAPNSGDVNLVYRIGDRPFVHEVKIDYAQDDGDSGIISNQPGRMNGSQNIIINNTKENVFRYVVYVNPLYDNIDQNYRFVFAVNSHEETDFTPDPSSPYVLTRSRVYTLKPGEKLRDSFKYDYDGEPKELNLIDEIKNDRETGNTLSYENQHLPALGNKPLIFVLDFKEKAGENADKVFASSALISKKNAEDSNESSSQIILESEAVLRDHNSDAGLVNSYKIGDKVWLDENKDGRIDENEPGVEDAIVKLKNSKGTIIDVTSTDKNGEYHFDNVRSGDYTVEFEVPENYNVTVDGGDSKGVTVPVKIETKNDMTIDLGLNKVDPGTIDIQHIYYHLPDGQNEPKETDKPEYVNSWKAKGYKDEKFRTYLQPADGFKLIKVESSNNVKSQPTVSSPETVNNYINGENQSIKFIYVKTGHVESEKAGKFVETHKYFETPDGQYSEERDQDPRMIFSNTTEGKESETFKTEKNERDGYKLVKVVNSNNVREKQTEAGAEITNNYIPEATQEISYIYVKKAPEPTVPTPEEPVAKKGSVDVVYKTKTGDILEKATFVAEDQPVGTPYNTDEKSFSGYQFAGMAKDSDKASGTVEEGTKHVIYLYEPVKEVAQSGKYVETHKYFETPDGQYDPSRDTQPMFSSERSLSGTTEEKFTANQIAKEGFTLVEVNTREMADAPTKDAPEKEANYLAGKTQEAHYIYVKAKAPEAEKVGSVDVTHKAVDGTILKATETVKENAKVGTEYTTSKGTFDGYRFIGLDETSDKANGNVEEGTKHVIYLYEPVEKETPKEPETPVEEKKGSVDVIYKTTTGDILKEKTMVQNDAPVGTEYSTEIEDFQGYRFVGMDRSSDKANGVVTEGEKHVIYLYEPVKEAAQSGKYVETHKYFETPDGQYDPSRDTQPMFSSERSLSGTTEEKFTANQIAKEGFTLVEVDTREMADAPTKDAPEKEANYLAGKTQEAHYIYVKKAEEAPKPEEPVVAETKKGTVIVEYKTNTGVILEGPTDVLRETNVGTEYTTEEKTFEGYRFVGMEKGSAKDKGVVTEGEQKVVYIYEKVTPTNDGSSQTEPGNPTNDGSTQTESGNPTNDGSTQTEPSNPTNDGSTQTEPSNPTNDGSTQTEPSNPTNDGSSQTEPGNPTKDESTQTEPEKPSKDEGSKPSNPIVNNNPQKPSKVEEPKEEVVEKPEQKEVQKETPKAETPKDNTNKVNNEKNKEVKVETTKKSAPKTGDSSQSSLPLTLAGLFSSLGLFLSRKRKKN